MYDKVAPHILSYMLEGGQNYESPESNLVTSNLCKYKDSIRTVPMISGNTKLWAFHACKLCFYKSKSYFLMGSHLRRHRVTRRSKVFSCIFNKVERYKCTCCDYQTSMLVHIRKHRRLAHAEIKVENALYHPLRSPAYTCPCEFKTFSKLAYLGHSRTCPEETIITKISIVDDMANKNQMFQCTMCDHKVDSKTALKTHIKMEHFLFGQKPTQTVSPVQKNKSKSRQVGAKKVPRTPTRARSERVAAKGMPNTVVHKLPRRVVSKVIPDSERVTIHNVKFLHKKSPQVVKKVITELTHIVADSSPQEKCFKCDYCGLKTIDDLELKAHILDEHVSLEVLICFKCQLCTFGTVKEEELKKHVMQEHVDSQYFDWIVCEMCSDKFKQKDDLKMHVFNKHIM